MCSMTYNSLVLEVEDYLERTDASTINRIPDFINQAEQLICRQIEDLGFEVYASGTLTAGLSIFPKPARWRSSVSFNYGTGTTPNFVYNPIYLRDYEFCRQYWPQSTATGAPQYYSDYGYNNILIVPTPDANYPFEFVYQELLQPLSINVQTNYLTNYAPDVLLFATLLQATPYLKDDERIAVWKQAYNEGMESLQRKDKIRKVDRESYREAD